MSSNPESCLGSTRALACSGGRPRPTAIRWPIGGAPIGTREGACAPRAAAFTLVELVVAVTLIALLVWLLTPALGRARCGSHRNACMSNLRQIALAFKQYAVDNSDAFPCLVTSTSSVTSSSVFLTLTNGSYLPIGKIYICPQDRGRVAGPPGKFDRANNSYACVVGDSTGLGHLTEGASSDNPLVFDRGLAGAPAPVHALASAKWLYSSPHREEGGYVLYVGGQGAFKKVFETGADGTNGFVVVP